MNGNTNKLSNVCTGLSGDSRPQREVRSLFASAVGAYKKQYRISRPFENIFDKLQVQELLLISVPLLLLVLLMVVLILCCLQCKRRRDNYSPLKEEEEGEINLSPILKRAQEDPPTEVKDH